MRITCVAGAVLVKVIENSTTTTKGRAEDPSGVDSSPLAGSVPVLVISAWTRLAAVGRLQVLDDERVGEIGCLCSLPEPPNSKVSSIRADLEGHAAAEVGAEHVDARALADRDGDLAEQPGVDGHARGDAA